MIKDLCLTQAAVELIKEYSVNHRKEPVYDLYYALESDNKEFAYHQLICALMLTDYAPEILGQHYLFGDRISADYIKAEKYLALGEKSDLNMELLGIAKLINGKYDEASEIIDTLLKSTDKDYVMAGWKLKLDLLKNTVEDPVPEMLPILFKLAENKIGLAVEYQNMLIEHMVTNDDKMFNIDKAYEFAKDFLSNGNEFAAIQVANCLYSQNPALETETLYQKILTLLEPFSEVKDSPVYAYICTILGCTYLKGYKFSDDDELLEKGIQLLTYAYEKYFNYDSLHTLVCFSLLHNHIDIGIKAYKIFVEKYQKDTNLEEQCMQFWFACGEYDIIRKFISAFYEKAPEETGSAEIYFKVLGRLECGGNPLDVFEEAKIRIKSEISQKYINTSYECARIILECITQNVPGIAAECISVFQSAMKIEFDTSGDTEFVLGNYYRKTGNKILAENYLTQAFNKRYVNAAAYIGFMYECEGNYSQALDYFNKAAEAGSKLGKNEAMRFKTYEKGFLIKKQAVERSEQTKHEYRICS